MSDSLQSHGLWPDRLLFPWGSPGKNTGSVLPFFSSGDLLGPGLKPGCPTLAGRFFTIEPLGKPLENIDNHKKKSNL